jgi:ABC-2 type transport system permease protein
VLLGYVLSLALSFFLGFFLEATLGMIGFWFLEVSSLLFVYMLFNFFLSGHMFPLDIVPGGWAAVLKVIPLQYLAFFPAAVALGKIQGSELVWGLLVQVGWLLFFIVACRLALRQGIKRYSGYGG